MIIKTNPNLQNKHIHNQNSLPELVHGAFNSADPSGFSCEHSGITFPI